MTAQSCLTIWVHLDEDDVMKAFFGNLDVIRIAPIRFDNFAKSIYRGSGQHPS